MGRIMNKFLNSGVKGLKQATIFEEIVEGTTDNIQKLQLKEKYELVAENGSYISKNLIYNNDKMENYLLNINHKDGYSKAKFLRDVLGYSNGDGVILYENIKKALIGQNPIKITHTPSGVKQEYNLKLQAKDGRIEYAKVVVVAQKDNGKSMYRIITLFPGKKEK